MVSLRSNLYCLSEGGRASGEEHELLESELISGMGSTIDDVESRSRENEGGLDTSEISEVLVEGDTLLSGTGLSDSNGNAEDGVGTKLALVGGTVELDEEIVDFTLRGDGQARFDQLRANYIVNIGDGFADA